MNVGGVLLLRFIGSLRAERRGAGGLRGRLHGAVLADHVDVGRADGRVGDDRRPESRRRQSRAGGRRRAGGGAHRPRRGRGHRRAVRADSRNTCSAMFGMTDPTVLSLGRALLRVSERVRLVHHRRAQLHRRPAGHRRHAQPALHLDRVAGRHPARPLRRRSRRPRGLRPTDIWLAIVVGHFTRCLLSVDAIPPGEVARHRSGHRAGAAVIRSVMELGP